MSGWERRQNFNKTEKAKRWLHAYGRKDFNHIEQIKKDTYSCSLHFVGQKGPTEEHPDRVKAGDEAFLKDGRENHQNKDYQYRKKQKKMNLI